MIQFRLWVWMYRTEMNPIYEMDLLRVLEYYSMHLKKLEPVETSVGRGFFFSKVTGVNHKIKFPEPRAHTVALRLAIQFKVEIEENMWFCKVGIITVVHPDLISFISSMLKKIQPLFFQQFYPFSSQKTNNFSPFSHTVSQENYFTHFVHMKKGGCYIWKYVHSFFKAST